MSSECFAKMNVLVRMSAKSVDATDLFYFKGKRFPINLIHSR